MNILELWKLGEQLLRFPPVKFALDHGVTFTQMYYAVVALLGIGVLSFVAWVAKRLWFGREQQ